MRGDTEFVTTDHERLRRAAFLDGREVFWFDRKVVPLARTALSRPPPPIRMIFHVGFCGSTLLARLLDEPGRTFVLREPQALADLSSQAALLGRRSGPQSVEAMLARVVAELAVSAPGDEAAVVKPSSWVNALAPLLASRGHIERAIFLSMDRRAFLRASFRGGRDRLAYCMRLTALLAACWPDGAARLQRAMEWRDDPLDRAAALSALLHAQQETLFTQARASLRRDQITCMDFSDLAADPLGVRQEAAAALNLPSPCDDSGALASTLLTRHAKMPSERYSADKAAEADEAIENHHAGRFDAALQWLERDWPQAHRRSQPVIEYRR